VVAEGLRRTGYGAAAEKSIHLSYAMVVLTPRCAAELGYELSAEDAKRPFIDMSGRKGFGVKADDLIDKLEAATLTEVKQRHAEMSEAEAMYRDILVVDPKNPGIYYNLGLTLLRQGKRYSLGLRRAEWGRSRCLLHPLGRRTAR